MNVIVGEIERNKYSEHNPEARLADQSPLYHALLSNALVVTASETEAAKNRFDALVRFDPDVVARCDGRTLEEAAEILEILEVRMNRGTN